MKQILSLMLICFLIMCVGCSKRLGVTHKGFLMELDPENNIVWENYDYSSPICFNRDNQGNKLIIDRDKNISTAINKDGEEVWVYFDGKFNHIERTPDGNFLLSKNESYNPSIVELNYLTEIVWKIDNMPYVTMASKLPTGNYILSSRQENAIKEIDKDGKVIWETKKDLLLQPYSVVRLSDGNYLISDFDHHRVIKIDKDSNILWKTTIPLNHPKSALKLKNGNYVIADADNARIIFIDKEGNIIHERKKIIPTSMNLSPSGNVTVSGQFVE
ncbi:MAG: PQQ-binding-like beta-propeller repeat protein [Cyanobacteriota bacterium]